MKECLPGSKVEEDRSATRPSRGGAQRIQRGLEKWPMRQAEGGGTGHGGECPLLALEACAVAWCLMTAAQWFQLWVAGSHMAGSHRLDAAKPSPGGWTRSAVFSVFPVALRTVVSTPGPRSLLLT